MLLIIFLFLFSVVLYVKVQVDFNIKKVKIASIQNLTNILRDYDNLIVKNYLKEEKKWNNHATDAMNHVISV